MFRKIALASLAVVAGLFILNSTHLGSYAKTAFKKVKNAAKAQVSLQFQLDNIKNEVAGFMPEMRKQVSLLAAETVAVQNLRTEVADLRVSLDKQRNTIADARDQLKTPVKTAIGGRNSVERLRGKLERDVNAYKRGAEELKAKEALLDAKERALDADKERLSSMRSQKEQWEVQIAQMETEVKLLEAAESRSKTALHPDNSKFDQIKASLADIRNQIKVKQTENAMWGQFADEGTADEPKAKSAAQVLKEADEIAGDNDSKTEARK